MIESLQGQSFCPPLEQLFIAGVCLRELAERGDVDWPGWIQALAALITAGAAAATAWAALRHRRDGRP
jgi:hypothetical protein